MQNDKIVSWLISESVNTDSNISIISDNRKCVKIEADLQDAAEINRNGRGYPKPTLNKGLTRENIAELILHKSWFGEAGHPVNPTPQRQMTIVQDNISHRVLSWEWRGSKVHGIVKTAPSKMGKFMRDCIIDEDPMESAFSLRAVGPVKETSQGKIVQDPLTVICYDWVFYPSHRKAYQTAVLDSLAENGNIMNECCIPLGNNLQESMVLNYVKDQSKNYKIISELMESKGLISELSNDNKYIIITESTDKGRDKIVTRIEDYISDEITNFYSNFRNKN